jgi:hypothetical protein
MALAVSCLLGVMTMRSCQSAPATSPANPDNLARQGVAGICANQQAVNAASGSDDSVPPVTLPPGLADSLGKADPAVAAVLAQATACPTETTEP